MNATVCKVAALLSVCCLLLVGSTTVTAQVAGLQNHYTFDDENDLGNDSSGNDRHGEVDDLGLLWVDDGERGGVLEFEGATNGFVVADIPDLTDEFTIMTWAYRDATLCCDGPSGANDGLFQVQPGDDEPAALLPPNTGNKVIGAWVQKSDAAVWGRIVAIDGTQNLDKSYVMTDEEWVHFAYRGTGEEFEMVVNGESGVGPSLFYEDLDPHDTIYIGRQGGETWGGRLDDFRVYDRALTDAEIQQVMDGDGGGAPMLQAGDADMDFDFDQIDLVQVQIAAKYLSADGATWGEGDWDAAPGGSQGNPPAGDGSFNQLDIIAALSAGFYLQGPYAAILPGGTPDDNQTSIVYYAATGEVAVDAPAGTNLTSVNIDSASGIFTSHENSQNLDGSFDTHSEGNIFKATFGSSFGSLSFGLVATAELAEAFVADDLTVIGSLDGGGGLGDVDLVYVPEPAGALLLALGALGLFLTRRRR